MSQGIKAKAISAVAWSGAETLSSQGLQFVISILLARLLAPEEFGMIATMSLFIGLAGVFVDGGFGSALIQKRSLTQEDTSSVFYVNIAMGLAMALVLGAASGWFARFYKIPVLQPLTCVMAANLFLTSFGTVHWALVARDLDFRTQMRISCVAIVISGSVVVFLAWRGWGVWSLAVQAVVQNLVSTILVWWCRSWRPSWVFSVAALRPMFRFGSYMFLSAVLEAAYVRMYTLLIGKLYSPRDLGFYTRADNTKQLPASTLATVVSRVTFPAFSATADDPARLRRGLRQALTGMMLINTPALLGLLAVSRPLVQTLFGDKWIPCISYLQILCLGALLWPLHVLNLNVLRALGRSDLFFRLELIKKAIGISTLLVTAWISVLAMAWGQVLVAVVCFFVNAYYTGKMLDYSAMRQVRDCMPAMLSAALMLVCVWPLVLLTALPPAVLLISQALTGALLYVGLCLVLKVPAFHDAVRELKLRCSPFASSSLMAKGAHDRKA